MDVEGVGVEDVVELKKVRFNGRGKVGLGRRGGKVEVRERLVGGL